MQGELSSSSLTNSKLVHCVWQEEEFNWLLKEEVHAVLKQLQDVLKVNDELSCVRNSCIITWLK